MDGMEWEDLQKASGGSQQKFLVAWERSGV